MAKGRCLARRESASTAAPSAAGRLLRGEPAAERGSDARGGGAHHRRRGAGAARLGRLYASTSTSPRPTRSRTSSPWTRSTAGRRSTCRPPTPRLRPARCSRACCARARILILPTHRGADATELVPSATPAAARRSLMFVPIRHGDRIDRHPLHPELHAGRVRRRVDSRRCRSSPTTAAARSSGSGSSTSCGRAGQQLARTEAFALVMTAHV